MSRAQPIARALLATCLVAAVASADHHETALELDTIIANHITAKGGSDAWGAIDSLRLTGEFTAFSKSHPFTLIKTRDRHYYLDHTWGNQEVVMGFDGEIAWWDNRFFGKGARLIEGADRAVLERNLDFATPFFDLETAKHQITLLGPQKFEGQKVIAIELQRADESKETWYLDASTFLEAARESPGSDFGRPMPQRTFFDDFRAVSGVMIPHYVESQWYTRNHVFAVDSVEVNVATDRATFAMPPPIGMDRLQNLDGSWAVAIESREDPSAPFSESRSESTIASHLRGALFEERWTEADGSDALRTLSYDQFRDRYLMTQIAASTNTMDILAGAWNEDGALVLDDVGTETPALMFGLTIYERLRLFDIEADSFKIERESSIDGGENWAVMQKLTYTRNGGVSAPEEATP